MEANNEDSSYAGQAKAAFWQALKSVACGYAAEVDLDLQKQRSEWSPPVKIPSWSSVSDLIAKIGGDDDDPLASAQLRPAFEVNS